jgi:hypothetical protein
MATNETKTIDLEDMTERLRHDAAQVRVAYAQLRSDEDTAWARYVHAVDATLETMEKDLQAEREVLKAERAKTQAELGEAVHELLDRVRGSIDDLQVQRTLFEMEARDRLNALRAPAEHALGQLRRRIDSALAALAFAVD